MSRLYKVNKNDWINLEDISLIVVFQNPMDSFEVSVAFISGGSREYFFNYLKTAETFARCVSRAANR